MNSICVTKAGDTKTHPVSASLVFLLNVWHLPLSFRILGLASDEEGKIPSLECPQGIILESPKRFFGRRKGVFLRLSGVKALPRDCIPKR